jgi:hypothetical protein
MKKSHVVLTALAMLFATLPFATLPAVAQDVITAGTIYGEAGTTINVPLSIRDVSGTPLGSNLAGGSRAQALSFKVTATPAAAVTNISFERAGVLQTLTPLYDRAATGTSSVAYIGSFSAPIPFTVNLTAPGNRIGTLLVALAPGTSPGTPIDLKFDAALTALSNLAGTTVESQYNRKLQLVAGKVIIGGTATTTVLTSSPNPSTAGSNVTFTANVSPATTGSVLFRDGSQLLGVATVTAGVATLQTSDLSQGTHTIRARFEGTGQFRGSDAAPLAQVVNAAPVTAPPSVVATATSSTSVLVTWPAVANATSYEISRSSNGGAFTVAGVSAFTSFSDTGRTANTTYVYFVRAVATGGGMSPASPRDIATTVMFTNDPLNPGTAVKRQHLTELRTAINAYRAGAGLAPAVFTDPSVGASTLIKAIHVEELRIAVQAARTAYGLSAPAFTDASLAGKKIKAVHFTELRAVVK